MNCEFDCLLLEWVLSARPSRALKSRGTSMVEDEQAEWRATGALEREETSLSLTW